VPYTIQITDAAAKQLKKLDGQIRKRLVVKIEELKGDPRPSGVKKLEGQERYRVRVGDYRIVYEIHDRQLVVIVVRIGDRKEVYR
jgi:mRNA interferase RelE/StbE